MKKFIALLLSLVICLTFVACGETKSSDKDSDKKDKDSTKEKVTYVADADEDRNDDSYNDNIVNAADKFFDTKTSEIASGETVTNDKCEFTVDYVEFSKDVMPPNPDSWYSHYVPGNGKVYVDFCIAYKNLETSNVSADDTISGTLIFNGKYEYTGFSIVEENNRSDLTYSSITSIAPLTTLYIHYLFEVPDEVQSSGGNVTLKMTIGDVDYKYVVCKGSGKVTVNSNAQTNKKSGAVSVDEIVGTKNSEFNIDYVNITNDVKPINPDDWYSHYEADSGNTYVDICFAYKNMSEKSVAADDVISAKLKYDGKYEYTGFSMIEEKDRSDFTYSSITSIKPLTTEYVHYLFEVPQEVADSGKSVVITFTIDGNTYTYRVQ